MQNGTLLSFDISNPGSVQLLDELYNTNGAMASGVLGQSGGNYIMTQMVQAGADTILVGSSTATGTDTQTGVGEILAINVSDPADINSDPPNTSKILDALQIPGTVQVHGLAIDGNQLFFTASQGGWLDPFTDVSDIGPTGNLVIGTVDISDPQNPQLIHTQTINRYARGGGDNVISLGNNRYAFSSLGIARHDPATRRNCSSSTPATRTTSKSSINSTCRRKSAAWTPTALTCMPRAPTA